MKEQTYGLEKSKAVQEQSQEIPRSAQFNFLSPRSALELEKILANLPPEIKDQIILRPARRSSSAVLEEGTIEDFAREWDEDLKRERALNYSYSEDDIKRMTEGSIELALYGSLGNAFRNDVYAPSLKDIAHAERVEDVEKQLVPFLDTLWKQRGTRPISHADDREMEDLKGELTEKSAALQKVEEEWTRKVNQFGTKKRLTRSESDQLTELQEEFTKLSGRSVSRHFGLRFATKVSDSPIEAIRARMTATDDKHSQFNALVMLSEKLSAEEFAIVVYEYLYRTIDDDSRRHPEFNPELLDFLERATTNWSVAHQKDEALNKPRDANYEQRVKMMIERLLSRLASFKENKDDPQLSDAMREGTEAEILIAARLLKRLADKTSGV